MKEGCDGGWYLNAFEWVAKNEITDETMLLVGISEVS